jgi:sec-independent protein translocase protein TatA
MRYYDRLFNIGVLMLAVIGTGELLVILGLVLVLFGGKRLPELAKNLGQGMREFKKACYGTEEIETKHECCNDKDQTCCNEEKTASKSKCCRESDKDIA